MSANESLKLYAKERGVPLWRVASAYGINDGNLSRRLRFEFSPEQAERFRRVVDEIECAMKQEGHCPHESRRSC